MKKKVYIACENVNFCWTQEDVKAFDQLWTSGTTDAHQLAKHFHRSVDDVAFLIYDRAHKGYIGPHGAAGIKGYSQGA